MGSGKSSGNQATTVQMTPEQRELLGAQKNFLTQTAFPTYQKTIGQTGNLYDLVSPAVGTAANTALDVTGRTGATQEAAGMGGLGFGMTGLASLFDPNYEKGQINAALQAGRESARESLAGQNAMYGGAGQGGSARQVLADKNLESLTAQRQATAASEAQARVQANKAAAANQMATLGSGLLTSAQQAAAGRASIASSPMDAFAKYASVIFGTPQASTTPNFQGTQGTTSSGGSRSKGISL